jgi:hypothetical protein
VSAPKASCQLGPDRKAGALVRGPVKGNALVTRVVAGSIGREIVPAYEVQAYEATSGSSGRRARIASEIFEVPGWACDPDRAAIGPDQDGAIERLRRRGTGHDQQRRTRRRKP